MKFEPIIESLLTNDAYKFYIGQAIFHQFQDYSTEWDFICYNEDVSFTPEMVQEITEQVQHFCTLSFKEEELYYLSKIPWVKPSYINFLRCWRPFFSDFTISTQGKNGLKILVKGSWLNSSMYESPILAIVNEVYYRMKYNYDELFTDFKARFDEKLKKLLDGTYELNRFSEFGLRRRISAEAEEYAIARLFENRESLAKKNNFFFGTSNVQFAKKYNLYPLGSVSHEFVEAIGQGNTKLNPAFSNWYAMDSWTKEYGVLNGLWVTDTIGDQVSLRDMGLTYSILFSGVRHDSGDPFAWGENWINHYQKFYDEFHDERVNPKNKTLLYSDHINFELGTKIYRHFKDNAKISFAIGSYLTNDTFVPPINIVLKIATCNRHVVAKLSNENSKAICRDPEYLEYLKRTIKWRLENEPIKKKVKPLGPNTPPR